MKLLAVGELMSCALGPTGEGCQLPSVQSRTYSAVEVLVGHEAGISRFSSTILTTLLTLGLFYCFHFAAWTFTQA